MDGPPVNDVCSICHANFHLPCQANCAHWFCGGCIVQLWEHGAAMHPCKCPLCRREITLLVPSQSSSTHHHNATDIQILQTIERYNRIYGAHSNGLTQRIQDLPFLLRRFARDIMDPQRSLPFVLRARTYLAMLASLIYVVSPVDLIPEALLGVFGLLDDMIIVLICLMHVAALYRALLVSRHGGGT